MTQAIQSLLSPTVAVGSSTLSSPVLDRSGRTSSCETILTSRRHPQAICQTEEGADTRRASPTGASSRRNFVISTTTALTAAAAALLTQADSAQAAKRTAPPPVEKKEEDDKSLSAYDAKLLASQRRKDALKEMLEKQKKKAKSVLPQSEDETPDIFGQTSKDGIKG